jgi:uncharacterized protein (TIGR03435 family)
MGHGHIGDPMTTLDVAEQAELLNAIREQLGLKLQTSRAPYDVILIEAISPLRPD